MLGWTEEVSEELTVKPSDFQENNSRYLFKDNKYYSQKIIKHPGLQEELQDALNEFKEEKKIYMDEAYTSFGENKKRRDLQRFI